MKKKLFLLLIFISVSTFSQTQKDSIAFYLNEYKKTKLANLPEKAFVLAEKQQPDSLLKNTYIRFGMRSFFNKDLTNLSLIAEKLNNHFIKTKDSFALAKSYYFQGLFFNVDLQSDSTFYYYNKSKNISIQLKDSLEVARRQLSMSALLYTEKDYLGSESAIIEGLRFVEPLGENFFTGLLYERLGNVLLMTDRQEEARENYLKFFEFQKKTPSLNLKYEKARLYNHIGKTYESEGNYTKSMEYFNKSLDIDSLQFKSVYRYEAALESLSYGYFVNGNKKRAIRGYLKVLKSRENRNYTRGLVYSHAVLAEFYESTKEFNKAIFHSKKAIELAKKINFSKLTLENLYRLSGLVKGEKGRQLLEEHFILNDSLFRRERSLKNQFAKVRYETEKKDNENAGLKIENDNKQLQIEKEQQYKIIGWLIAGASILFIAFGLSIVSIRRKKLLFENKMLQIKAREKERQQIAKKLHDEVAGDIIMLHLKLVKTNHLEEAESLDVIKENIRNLSHQLSSESFDKVIFRDQVINLISEYFEINFRIKVQGIDDVDWTKVKDPIKRTLYLAIRESIQNAKKYADAKDVFLTFSETKKTLCLTISDNGKGFNTSDKKNGIGLNNMKERIEEINGAFVIESVLEKGTKTKIKIPKDGK